MDFHRSRRDLGGRGAVVRKTRESNHPVDDYSVLQVRNWFRVEWSRVDLHVEIVLPGLRS